VVEDFAKLEFGAARLLYREIGTPAQGRQVIIAQIERSAGAQGLARAITV
jgi:hypothetical protein